MTLPTIQSLWIGDRLSNMEKLCVQSFLDHGHAFDLYAYGDVAGVPTGARILDANEILHADKIFRHKTGSYAPFSDWFRYALMAKRGGWWVDMDMICLKPFDFAEEVVFLFDEGFYGNAPLHFPPAHPLMRDMEKSCREDADKTNSLYVSMGILKLTELVLRHNMQKYGKPCSCFSPWGHNNWAMAFDKTFADGKLFGHTYSIHIHNEMLRLAGVGKDAQFDAESLFEQLKRKHGIAQAPNAPRITSDDLHRMLTQKNYYGLVARLERRRKRKKKIIAALACIAAAAGLAWFV